MKTIVLFMTILASLTSYAQYQCHGPKKTSLESFRIYTLTATELETGLDGTLDVAEESLDKKFIEYIYNNGCDNDVTFRISKLVAEYRPQSFNMRVDYLTYDEILTDAEVVCFKL